MSAIIRKLPLFLLACAICAWAADFWIAKPYTEWSSKELQKLMSDSPWAHRVDVELSVRMPSVAAQSEGGGRGGRGSRGGGGGEITAPDGGPTTGADLSGARGGESGGRGGPGGAAGGSDGPMTQAIPVVVVWQTALPIKQALVKARYGTEAANSADAKAFLERAEEYYVLNVGGLPISATLAGAGEKKSALLQLTSLSVKGKQPLHAAEVQFNNRERQTDAVFFFPRADLAMTPDDKEVEFSTKFDKLAVKYRFKLKEMLYHGKLEL